MSHHGPMDAYSEDLRHKIVEALQQRRMSKSEAARVFGVSRSSVKRYVKAVCQGRSLRPGKAPGKIPARYTHQQLASMVGANREAITRALGVLGKAGTVQTRNRQIYVIDADALEYFAEVER